MLKKLVKYGNSNALVLDKAILEILNMGEGSVVKISTDGTSLIITPYQEKEDAGVHETFTSSDALKKASVQQGMQYAHSRLDVAQRQELEQKVIAAHKRLADVTNQLEHHDEFQKEMNKWRDTYSNDTKKLMQKFEQVVKKHIPEFLQARAEFERLNKELVGVDSKAVKNYGKVKKGFEDTFMRKDIQAIMAKFAQISATEEYQHRAQLLTEKYEGSHNSKEFMKEMKQLAYEFCPEMQDLHKQVENNVKQ